MPAMTSRTKPRTALKMQGVDQLADFAVQIRAKMMPVPGEQFVIRRQAYAMIKKAFDENGIQIRLPDLCRMPAKAKPPPSQSLNEACNWSSRRRWPEGEAGQVSRLN